MKKKRILFVIGARPNYMKLAPIWRYYKKILSEKYDAKILHTNQHKDDILSISLLNQLGIEEIHYNLLGKKTEEWSFGRCIDSFNLFFKLNSFDWIVVFGDVHSTICAALSAKYNNLKLAHIESGLRSFDITMPEEVNRLCVDSISDLHFTTSLEGNQNLIKEGVSEDKIVLIGNLMIDSLFYHYKNIKENEKNISSKIAILTLHRPSNVDNKDNMLKILTFVRKISERIQVHMPIHPRTQKKLEEFDLMSLLDSFNIVRTGPLSYFEMIDLYQRSLFVLTDSGGIQEETSALSIPCLTLRENTERPITVSLGTNTIVGLDEKKLFHCIEKIFSGTYQKGSLIPYWDGLAANRFWDDFTSHIK